MAGVGGIFLGQHLRAVYPRQLFDNFVKPTNVMLDSRFLAGFDPDPYFSEQLRWLPPAVRSLKYSCCRLRSGFLPLAVLTRLPLYARRTADRIWLVSIFCRQSTWHQ